jgi:hypothetical protein
MQEELAVEKPQPELEFLLDKETKVRIGYNPKLQMAHVAKIILKFAKWDFDHIRQKTKSVNDDLIRILGSMQEFLKNTDINDCTPEGEYANLEEIILRLVSVRRSWRYRIQFTKIVLRLFRPFADNERNRTTLVEDGAIDKTYEFLLDLFLPPDRAEETSTALQDVCQSKWQKRYGPCDRGEGNWKAKVMAFFSLKPSASCLKTAVLVSGLLLISAQGHAEPGSAGPFLGLSGHWSGAGTVTMTDGATERIRCKAAYGRLAFR